MSWEVSRPSDRHLRPALLVLSGLLVLTGLALALSLATRPAGAPGSERTVPLAQGAARMEAEVPVGYQRTEAGAVDAATNYLVALNSPLVLYPEGIRAAEAVMAAPAYRDQLIAAGDANLRAMNAAYGVAAAASRGVQVVIRYVPIAFHLDSFDGRHAAVSVWAVWVLAEAGILAPQQHWLVSTILLEWLAGDWKVTGAGSRRGPAPFSPEQQVLDPTSPLPDALSGYLEYRHVSA